MKNAWPIVVLFAVFLAVRIYFILTFPPFTDESLYIRWGMLMIHNPAYHWASIQYISRQPLAFWLFGIGATVLRHPLIGARLVVLLCNVPAFFATYLLTKKLTDRRTGIIALAVLSVTPLFILVQSLALMDGLLFAIGTALIWLCLAPERIPDTLRFVALGLLLGAALWIKTTGLILLLCTVLAMFADLRRRNRPFRTAVFPLFIPCFVALLSVSPLFFHPEFHRVLTESRTFVSTASRLEGLAEIWKSNGISVLFSLLLYIGPWFLAAGFLAIRKRTYPVTLGVIWFFLPLVLLALLSNSMRFRYVAIGAAVCIPLIAAGVRAEFERGRRGITAYALGIVAGIYCVVFIVNPVRVFALFPEGSGERDYAISWPSGYGIPELIRFIDERSQDSGMVIAVADSPGNPGDYLLANYFFSDRVRVLFATITDTTQFRKIEPVTRQVPVYLATRESLVTPPIRPYLTPVARFEKPLRLDAVSLYRITF